MKWCNEGKIPFYKTEGNQRRFLKKDIDDFLKVNPPIVTEKVEEEIVVKKKTWKDDIHSLDEDELITKLAKTTKNCPKNKELKPFWVKQKSHLISEKIWFPSDLTKVESMLEVKKNNINSSNHSWFSIIKKSPLEKDSRSEAFKLSDYKLPKSLEPVIKKRTKPVKKPKEGEEPKKPKPQTDVKTLKFRIFPEGKEKEDLQEVFTQFRWYYNASVAVFNKTHTFQDIIEKNKFGSTNIRDEFRKYKYVETETDSKIVKDFVRDKDLDEFPQPLWWEKSAHNRIPRGASEKFTSNLNSAITNYKNGNINEFKMGFRTKKNKTDYALFEDKSFPAFIRDIKSIYWYTTKGRKRKTISFSELDQTRGLELIYEKETDRYFLHYPVDRNWFPEDDRRIEKQERPRMEGSKVISLDPGIRKFLVGYDPEGSMTFFGEKACKTITEILLKLDKEKDKEKDKEENRSLWRYVKNLIIELHWKTISYLVNNYNTIIMPDFKVSEMIKGKKLSKPVKRLMTMFSFCSFKERLKYKCAYYKKQLIIVDESYTSCTCTNCGNVKKSNGLETYNCVKCNMIIDRDVAGSRNIFIKNSTLEKPRC